MSAVCMSVALASVFLWTGLSKMTNLEATASTIRALHASLKWSRHVAALIALAEVAAAVGLVFAPNSLFTVVTVCTLAGSFALAGCLAVVRKDRIRCYCFGTSPAGAYLGWKQLAALPLWMGAAIFLYRNTSTSSLVTKAILLVAIAVLLTSAKTFELWREVRESRDDRLSAQEMYLWLPQR